LAHRGRWADPEGRFSPDPRPGRPAVASFLTTAARPTARSRRESGASSFSAARASPHGGRWRPTTLRAAPAARRWAGSRTGASPNSSRCLDGHPL